MKQKKVLFIIEMLNNGGGAQRVICRLANELSKNHQVYLMYFRTGDKPYTLASRVHLIKPEDSPVWQMPEKRSFWRMLLWHLKNYLAVFTKILKVNKIKRENQIDTTISFLKLGNIVNVLSKGKDKRIVSERDDPTKVGIVYRISSSFAHFLADFAVFQSKRVRNMYCGRVQKKSAVIFNPTEVSCGANAICTKKVVTVGRLTEQKNQKLLIRAFAMFHKFHREHHLYIYGRGELLDELQKTAEQYNIQDFVHFEGFKEDIHAAIADAEQFVLSSDHEGLSNALMEAMMMGHACISTNCAGSDELIKNGENGLLVPVGDTQALCEAMCRLSDNPELRAKLGHAAAHTAGNWSTEQIVRLWENFL